MEEIQGPSQEGADRWTAVCLKVGQSTSVGVGGLFYHRHCFELLHGDIKSRLSLSSITFLVCLQGGPLLPAPRAGCSQSLPVFRTGSLERRLAITGWVRKSGFTPHLLRTLQTS